MSSGRPRLQRAISLKLVAEGFGRFLQLGTLALAARLLPLEEFGYYGLGLATGFLVAQLTDFGLHLFVTRQLSREPNDKFLSQALTTKCWLGFGISLLAALVVLYGGPGQVPFLLLLLSGPVYSLAEFGFAALRAANLLHYEARLIILHRLSLLVVASLVFLSGSGLVGLALAHLLASGLVAGLALRLSRVQIGFYGPDLRLLRRTAPIGLAIFLSLLAFKLDLPLLQLLQGRSDEVGLYNAAYRLFEPLLLFPAALMAGLFPLLSRHNGLNRTAIRVEAKRLLSGLAGAGLAAGALLALIAQWIIPFFNGPAYQDAVFTLELLALAVPCLFLNAGLTHLVLALNRERYNLICFAGALVLNLGLNLWLIPLWGRNAAALTTGLTELGLSIMAGAGLIVALKTLPAPKIHEIITPETSVTRRRLRISGPQLTFAAFLLLILNLPFELTQYSPVRFGQWLSLNNLKAIYYVNLILAAYTLWQRRKELRSRLNWRNPEIWLGAGVVVCLLSTAVSVVPRESLKFTVNVALGGLLWLALPFWLEKERERKLRLITVCLVASASLSAGLGLLEFIPELDLNNGLLSWFKAKETVAGPFLRLSGTFEYANIAAMYYELVLPFAFAGLVTSLQDKKWFRTALWLLAIGMLWEGVLLTFSRAALPGLLMAAPLLALTIRRYRPQAWGGLLLSFGLGLGLVALSAWFFPAMLARFKSESDQGWFRASYDAPAPGILATCQEVSLPVVVHNLTPLDWYGGPKSDYHLSYHWLDDSGYLYEMEGIRTNLPGPLKSGSQLELMARLRAPDKPGHYQLVWDMVQEDVTWFSFKSAVYTPQPVEVISGPSSGCFAAANPGTKTGDKPDSPLALPVAPPNPERSQLWKVAVKMALDRPWLGVGPDGYRFAYGQYAGVREWDNRIFANSTPLELVADLGLSGLLVFGVFFGLACRSLAKAGWLGKLTPFRAAGLVALVAFSLHGLLDYFFGAHVILVFFWILLGLARESRNAGGN